MSCRRFGAGVIALLVAALIPLVDAASAPAAAGCAGADVVPADEAGRAQAARTILCLVNRTRAAHGMRRVRVSRQLASAARFHASDMVSHRFFGHEGSHGDTLAMRISRVGYFSSHPGSSAAEALAWGTEASPEVLVQALMQSPEHRRILLDRSARDVGLGLALGAAAPGVMDSSATLTLDFGV